MPLRNKFFLLAALFGLLLSAGCSHDTPQEGSVLDAATYTPKAAHGVRCGASLNEFFKERKSPHLLSLDPRNGSRVYAESVIDPIFSRVEYTVRGGKVVDVSAYSGQMGLYETLSAQVAEILEEPTEVSVYPNPVRTRWVFGTLEVSVLEEAGEVVLRTSCPMEAGR